MKNKLLGILAVTSIVLGAFCYVQWRELQTKKDQVVVLKQNLAETDERAQNAETALESQRQLRAQDSEISYGLAAKVQELLKAKEETAQKMASLSQAKADSSSDENGLPGMLSKMLENPDMKKIIAEQQKLMLDTMYAPLFKQLKLSPEETTRLKSILSEQQTRAMEQGLALMGSKKEGDLTQTAEALAREQNCAEHWRECQSEGLGILAPRRTLRTPSDWLIPPVALA